MIAKAPRTISTAKKAGFTLVETFVAISVLMVALVGPLTIAQKGLADAEYSRDAVTAYYLAQDSIEYVRNLRDDDTLAGNTANWSYLTAGGAGAGWLTGIPAGCFSGTCRVDTVSGTGITTCSGSSCVLDLDPTSHLYQYSTGSATMFARQVAFTSNSDHEVVMTVTILWRSSANAAQDSLVISEHLFNWQ